MNDILSLSAAVALLVGTISAYSPVNNIPNNNALISKRSASRLANAIEFRSTVRNIIRLGNQHSRHMRDSIINTHRSYPSERDAREEQAAFSMTALMGSFTHPTKNGLSNMSITQGPVGERTHTRHHLTFHDYIEANDTGKYPSFDLLNEISIRTGSTPEGKNVAPALIIS